MNMVPYFMKKIDKVRIPVPRVFRLAQHRLYLYELSNHKFSSVLVYASPLDSSSN